MTDPFSVVVDLSFVLAAVSWWLVPEVTLALRPDAALRVVLVVILVCQIPMVLFLLLMSVLGQAQKPM